MQKILLMLIVFCATVMFAEAELIVGAGATFPYPLYQKWIELYGTQTGRRVFYQGVGSTKGIAMLYKGEVDFCGSDAFLDDEQLAAAPAPVLHMPTCIGAVAIIYNIPGQTNLHLDHAMLAAIFLGEVNNWAAPPLRNAFTKDVASQPITVVHRSEGSGTTYVLTDYLAKTSKKWAEKVGAGTKVRWPCGIGVEKNSGVADMVKQIPGSIGYVEMTYAYNDSIAIAAIRNAEGRFVTPTIENVAAAAASVILPDDTRIYINNSPSGYPISALTWMLFYQEQAFEGRSRNEAIALASWLWWILHEGQKHVEALHYVPLPPSIIQKAEAIIGKMTYAGKPLDKGSYAP